MSPEPKLYSFPDTGHFPSADLVRDPSGAFYGVATNGGLWGFGSVFRIAPPALTGSPWTYETLYSFTGWEDGRWPKSSLIIDSFGALYGTTWKGGHLVGTVFKLTPPVAGQLQWTKTILHQFGVVSDGKFPVAPLTLGTDGSLFGVTTAGGVTEKGLAFQLKPPASGATRWQEVRVHDFVGLLNGHFPETAVVQKDGALYGSTPSGGYYGRGAIYKLTPLNAGATRWTETLVHSFRGANFGDGEKPQQLMLGTDGAIYGSTAAGLLFKVCPGVATSC